MRTLIQDLRYGLRLLARSPGFTAIALLTLMLGIGATAVIFSVVDAVLLRALPYRDPQRLVSVFEDISQAGFPRNTPAPGNYSDWKAQTQIFNRSSFLTLGIGATAAIFSVVDAVLLRALPYRDPQQHGID